MEVVSNDPLAVSLISDRRDHPALGFFGGHAGAPVRITLNDGQFIHPKARSTLKPGDRLLLFTDGLVEACNADDEAFGEEGLIAVAREKLDQNAGALMNSLIQASSAHCGGHFQDDASMVVLRAI